MKKKYMTTYWMDLLTYIILPFITIVATFRVVRTLLFESFSWNLLYMLIIEALFIGLYVITFLSSHNRTKLGYTCFRVLVIATAIRAALDFAFSGVSDYGTAISLIGYLAICSLVWVYPNEIYFKNRKELFKNESKIKIPCTCCKKKENKKKDK